MQHKKFLDWVARKWYQRSSTSAGACIFKTRTESFKKELEERRLSIVWTTKEVDSDSLPDSSAPVDGYRYVSRKYMLLEEDSFAVEGALSKVEDEVKTLEDEKFALLDQLVVLEGPDWSFRSAAQWVVVPCAGTIDRCPCALSSVYGFKAQCQGLFFYFSCHKGWLIFQWLILKDCHIIRNERGNKNELDDILYWCD